MIDPELIRRCVKRADGWEMDEDDEAMVCQQCANYSFVEAPAQWQLDALAAQLVRQLEKKKDTQKFLDIEVLSGITTIWAHGDAGYPRARTMALGLDRTENTLKAIDQFYEEQ